MITQNTLHYSDMPSSQKNEEARPHSTTPAVFPKCEKCGLPARNAYPASNGKTYDLCDTHLYRLCDYILAWHNTRLNTKLQVINAELQREREGGQVA